MDAKETHHIFNLIYIGLIAIWSTYSWLIGQNGKELTAYVLVDSLYFVLDSCFIICRPSIVRAPVSVVFHHIISFIGAYGVAYNFPPLRYMLVELQMVDINTWFLILRQWQPKRHILTEILFYSSWVAIRMIYYPYLLYKASIRAGEGAAMITILLLIVFLNVLNFKWSYDLFKKTLSGKREKEHYL